MPQLIRRSIPRPRDTRAQVVGLAFLLAAVAVSPANAQSGAVTGSMLDPQDSNESLMPAGGFRLEGPNEPAGDGNSSLYLPGAGFGLQIYGSFNLDQQQQPESEPAPAPAAPSP